MAERDGDRWTDVAEVGGANRDVNGVASQPVRRDRSRDVVFELDEPLGVVGV